MVSIDRLLLVERCLVGVRSVVLSSVAIVRLVGSILLRVGDTRFQESIEDQDYLQDSRSGLEGNIRIVC
jgi:hypothetical protein